MSNKSEYVKTYRKRIKQYFINAFGGKCLVCGYNRCNSALEFHHLDPNSKEFTISSVRGNIKSWKSILTEIKKCILVCSNCHKEIHDDLIEIENKIYFNEKYENYSCDNFIEKDECPVCKNFKPVIHRTCSRSCGIKYRKIIGKIDWDKIDLDELLKTKSMIDIAEEFNIGRSTINKRLAKLTLIEKEEKNKEKNKSFIRKWKDIFNDKVKFDKTNVQIAKELHISEAAVRKNLKRLKTLDNTLYCGVTV